MVNLFCYGSNNPEMLTLLGITRDFKTEGGFLVGWERIFREYSGYWNGGVATVRKNPDAVVFGYIVHLTEEEIIPVDRYEGPWYEKQYLDVNTLDGLKKCLVYVMKPEYRDGPEVEPSQRYMESILKTVSLHWE